MTEDEARQAVITEALTWRGTPYHHRGRVKGAGCDCLTFITCVVENTGILNNIDIPYYGHQYGLHRDGETYLEGILKYCREVESPKPADIVMWKFGRVFSHAAIVIDWPKVIHSNVGRGVDIDDAEAMRRLSQIGENGKEEGKPRPKKFFSYW